MNPEQNHKLFVIQGLKDDEPVNRKTHRNAANKLKREGLDVVHYTFGWHDGADYPDKLAALSETIEEEIQEGQEISLLGTSMGGAVAVAAFMEQPESVSNVVTVGSRLNTVQKPGYLSLSELAMASELTIEALGWLDEQTSTYLTPGMRGRIMNISVAGDDRVPLEASVLGGAHNVFIDRQSRNHVHAVRRTLDQESGLIADFVKHGVIPTE